MGRYFAIFDFDMNVIYAVGLQLFVILCGCFQIAKLRGMPCL